MKGIGVKAQLAVLAALLIGAFLFAENAFAVGVQRNNLRKNLISNIGKSKASFKNVLSNAKTNRLQKKLVRQNLNSLAKQKDLRKGLGSLNKISTNNLQRKLLRQNLNLQGKPKVLRRSIIPRRNLLSRIKGIAKVFRKGLNLFSSRIRRLDIGRRGLNRNQNLRKNILQPNRIKGLQKLQTRPINTIIKKR